MPRKALFLVNPAAGKRQSREPLFDAAAVLSQAGYLLNIHLTSGRGDATETARREGADYDLVLCSGGDGTLNETITGLMDLPSPPPLGYLPRGSTNDFAASLGIPAQPAEGRRPSSAPREGLSTSAAGTSAALPMSPASGPSPGPPTPPPRRPRTSWATLPTSWRASRISAPCGPTGSA